MYQDYQVQPKQLTKCLMAALFVGIFAVLADEIYNFAYRWVTGFSPSEIFNVSSLIFGTLIFFMLAGMIYFFVTRLTAKADIVYTGLMLVLTVAGVFLGLKIHRSVDAEVTTVFRGLFIGVELIIGLMAAFLVPYYVKHYRVFL
jgi:hypothetical protein